MPSADSGLLTAGLPASEQRAQGFRGVIRLPQPSDSERGKATAYRAAAYLLAFVGGVAAMFAFQHATQKQSGSTAPHQPTIVAGYNPTADTKPPRLVASAQAELAPASTLKSLEDLPATNPPEDRSPPSNPESPNTLRLTGVLEPAPGRFAKLPLATSQAVAFVDVKPGDRVEKGWQVFSHWESPDRLQTAKLELAKTRKLRDVAASHAAAAQKTAVRMRKLAGQVSAQEAQDADTAANVRQQELESLQLAVAESESRYSAMEFEFNQAFVTSPIDGVVAAVDLAVGERRQLGGPFRGVAILDPSVLSCRCQLDERQLASLERAKPIETPESKDSESILPAVVESGGKQYDASVVSIGVLADANTGLIPVLLEVQNPDFRLRAGTRVEVTISPSVTEPQP